MEREGNHVRNEAVIFVVGTNSKLSYAPVVPGTFKEETKRLNPMKDDGKGWIVYGHRVTEAIGKINYIAGVIKLFSIQEEETRCFEYDIGGIRGYKNGNVY